MILFVCLRVWCCGGFDICGLLVGGLLLVLLILLFTLGLVGFYWLGCFWFVLVSCLLQCLIVLFVMLVCCICIDILVVGL